MVTGDSCKALERCSTCSMDFLTWHEPPWTRRASSGNFSASSIAKRGSSVRHACTSQSETALMRGFLVALGLRQPCRRQCRWNSSTAPWTPLHLGYRSGLGMATASCAIDSGPKHDADGPVLCSALLSCPITQSMDEQTSRMNSAFLTAPATGAECNYEA